jgi:hypothetical protein
MTKGHVFYLGQSVVSQGIQELNKERSTSTQGILGTRNQSIVSQRIPDMNKEGQPPVPKGMLGTIKKWSSTVHHRVDRVPGFLSSRPHWDS